MDPFQTFSELTKPLPTLEEAAGHGGRDMEQFRPRDYDTSESAMTVGETNVSLRKEELLRLLIAGKRTREAAEAMQLGVGTIRTYMKCPEFQQKLWNHDQKLWSRIDEELRVAKLSTALRIQELSETALERIERLMNSEDESIVLKASVDILDRNPETSKHSKQDVNSFSVQIDPAQLMLAAAAAQEMAERRGEADERSRPTIDGDSPA